VSHKCFYVCVITSESCQVHWRQHTEFKLATLAYKVLNGLYLHYLRYICQFPATTDLRQLRSSNITMREIPRTHSSLGDSLLLDHVYGTTYLSTYVMLDLLSWRSSTGC